MNAGDFMENKILHEMVFYVILPISSTTKYGIFSGNGKLLVDFPEKIEAGMLNTIFVQ